MLLELVYHVVHVLDGDVIAHETQQPSVYESLRQDVEVEHVQVKVVYFYLQKFYYAAAVMFQVNETLQIDCSQLFDFHHFHESPESLLSVFDMIKQNPSNHIHSLHIAHLIIIYAIGYKNTPQHPLEMVIRTKSRTL